MQKRILTALGILCSVASFAQNDIDALRYSQLTFGGTARFNAMAGSMGALGGDISCLSFNPAGIAVFRKTEISLSPSIFSQGTTSNYNGMNDIDSRLNANLGNIGIIVTGTLKENKAGWEMINFGLGYNRTNNFYNRISTQGYNTSSSLLDVFVANANGHESSDFDQFSTGLAWQTWLINPDTSGNLLYNHVIPNYGELQKRSLESKGSMGETVFSFGGNYKNKVLLGATLGYVMARYEEETTYEEIDDQDTISDFKSFSYTQSLTSRGKGINFKLGVIVKPTDWLRLGASIHTPTGISMADVYSSTMKSDLDHGIKYDTSSAEGRFNYTVTTPFRAMGSIGFVINKRALLNVDYEYIDYTYASLHSSPNVFAEVNTAIRSKYTSTGNLRVGGEVRLDPFTIRAGYALYGSPFRNGENVNATRSSFTTGAGYRQDNYFIDIAYVYNLHNETSYLYDPEISNPVNNKFRSASFIFTLGVRF